MAGLPVIVSNVVELSKIVNLAGEWGSFLIVQANVVLANAIEEILRLDLVQLGIRLQDR